MFNIFWALLVLFAIAALFRMDRVYYLAYVVGGIWLFSHWWVRRSLSRVEIGRELNLFAFAGETIQGSVRLNNQSWLPLPWLHLQETVPFELLDQPNYRAVLSVPGKARTTYPYTLRCSKRGYYPIGPLRLNTGDLFGFVDAGWQEMQPVHLTVYPRVFALEKLGLPSRSPFGTQLSRQRIYEDPTRLAGVRNYAPGDSLRNIHWKATAREETLQVKKFQPAIALNVTVVLDLNKNAYPISGAVGSSEWAVTVAASVASHIVTIQRQQIGLITNGLDPLAHGVATAIPARNGRGHLMSILGLLARVQMHAIEPTLAEWLPRQLANLDWGSTLIVVTPNLDANALWALHNAYRRGSSVVVLVCAPDPSFKQMQAQGERLGVHLYRAVWEKDLHEMAEQG